MRCRNSRRLPGPARSPFEGVGVFFERSRHGEQTRVFFRRRRWASSRDAALACPASRVICSFKVMWLEGKPKSQSEKCEVSSILRTRLSILPSPCVRQTGRIDSAIIAKLLPKIGERISVWRWIVIT